VKRGKRRESAGLEPNIGERHLRAVQRLSRAWEVSQTITAGVSLYGQRVVGAIESGYLSDARIELVNRQIAAAREIATCRLAMGVLWPIIEAVGLKGQTLKAWSLIEGIDEEPAAGFLRAALDVLVAWQVSLVDRRESRIRSAKVV